MSNLDLLFIILLVLLLLYISYKLYIKYKQKESFTNIDSVENNIASTILNASNSIITQYLNIFGLHEQKLQKTFNSYQNYQNYPN